MELEKKPKLDHFSCCVACLQEHVDKINGVSDDIINIYKNLLQEQINKLAPITLKFCNNCISTLEHILEFQKHCLNSIISLNSHSSKLQFDSVFVKEEIDSDDGVEVKMEDVPFVTSPEKIPKRARKQKVSTVLPVAKKWGLKPNKSKNSTNPHQCDDCDASYPTSTILKYHVIAKHLGGFKCKHCVMAYINKATYNRHMKRHEQNIRSCHYCSYKSYTTASLTKHIRTLHDPASTIICNECGDTFKMKGLFKYHFMKTHMKKRHRCSYCKKEFFFACNLKKHIRLHYITEDAVAKNAVTKYSSITNDIKKENLQMNETKCELKESVVDEASQLKVDNKEVKVETIEKKKEGIFCGICNEVVRSFKRHISLHTTLDKNKHYKCNLCSKTCADTSALVVHFANHSEYDEPRKCPDCDVAIKSRNEYRVHVRKHKEHILGVNHKIYLCDYCDAWHAQPRNFKRHVLVKHLGASRCKYCNKPFLDKKEYEKHMQEEELKVKVKPDRFYYCEHCGFKTKWTSALWLHKKELHAPDEPSIICDKCSKTFKTRQKFTQHFIHAHLEKQHCCSDCGKKFTYATDLRKHIRLLHTLEGAAAYRNCEHCGKTLKISSLRHHISSVHLQIRKWPCKLCDMIFKSAAVLKKHQHTHNKTRPFNCNLCPTGYYQNEYLRKHFERVHGIVYTGADIRKICGKKRD